MSVLAKILALCGILLLLFGVVLIGSVMMQKHSNNKVAAIVEFHLPLAETIADLEVATAEYELIIRRFLRKGSKALLVPAFSEAERQALDKTKARITADFERADAVLARALADRRTDR